MTEIALKELDKIKEYQPQETNDDILSIIGLNDTKLDIERAISFPVGTLGQVWTADPSQPSGGKWTTPTGLVEKYCFASNNGNQTLSTGSGTTLTLNTYSTNDSGMSTTGNQITITKAGRYIITAAARYNSNATGIRGLILLNNGGSSGNIMYNVALSGNDTYVQLMTELDLAVNDYLQIQGFQNSGGNLDTIANYVNLKVVGYFSS